MDGMFMLFTNLKFSVEMFTVNAVNTTNKNEVT